MPRIAIGACLLLPNHRVAAQHCRWSLPCAALECDILLIGQTYGLAYSKPHWVHCDPHAAYVIIIPINSPLSHSRANILPIPEGSALPQYEHTLVKYVLGSDQRPTMRPNRRIGTGILWRRFGARYQAMMYQSPRSGG